MNVLILLGERRGEKGERIVDNLYTGTDGIKFQEIADLAAGTKSYSYIGRVSNPFSTPMPIDPIKTTGTIPTFPRPKAVEHKNANQLPNPIEDALAKQRAERFKVPPVPKPVEIAQIPSASPIVKAVEEESAELTVEQTEEPINDSGNEKQTVKTNKKKM